MAHVGVALKDAVQLAQGPQLLNREEALAGQYTVQHWSHVAFGEDKAIPLLPIGIAGVHRHLPAEVEPHQQLHGRERAAGMAGTGLVGHVQNIAPHLGAAG